MRSTLPCEEELVVSHTNIDVPQHMQLHLQFRFTIIIRGTTTATLRQDRVASDGEWIDIRTIAQQNRRADNECDRFQSGSPVQHAQPWAQDLFPLPVYYVPINNKLTFRLIRPS